MSETLRHLYEVYIRTTPEKLWDALTNGDVTKQYFYGATAHSNWKPGSTYELIDEDGDKMLFGDVIESDPPRKLVYTFNAAYHPAEDRDPPSRVTCEIAPMGEICKLTLVHEHFAGETETFKSTRTGWGPVLSGLKTFLETGKPLGFQWPQEATTG